jgi:REP element-mobilizing transposase RayT
MGHTFTHHLFHVVFSTKQRRPWLNEGIRPRLYQYLAGVARRKQGAVLCAGGTEDHVHLLVSLQPNVSVSAFVGALKANSSRWLAREPGGTGGFAWQAGYSSFTVSRSNAKSVAAYIARQRENHSKLSFPAELAKLLRKHGIPFEAQHYLD